MKRGLLLSEFFNIVNDQKTDEERFNLLNNKLEICFILDIIVI